MLLSTNVAFPASLSSPRSCYHRASRHFCLCTLHVLLVRSIAATTRDTFVALFDPSRSSSLIMNALDCACRLREKAQPSLLARDAIAGGATETRIATAVGLGAMYATLEKTKTSTAGRAGRGSRGPGEERDGVMETQGGAGDKHAGGFVRRERDRWLGKISVYCSSSFCMSVSA